MKEKGDHFAFVVGFEGLDILRGMCYFDISLTEKEKTNEDKDQ